jgi:uncharacterized protein HemX
MDPVKDNQPTPPASPAPVRGVMDIQARRPQPDSGTPPTQPVITPPVASSQPPAVAEPLPAPTTPTVPEPPAPETSRPGLSPDLLAQAQAETAKPADHDPTHPKVPKKRGPTVAIIVAVVVALGLAGVAVYAYQQSQSDKPAHDANHMSQDESSTAPSNTQPATTSDVDAATKDLDSAIGATSEAQEIPESGLSESSLGL